MSRGFPADSIVQHAGSTGLRYKQLLGETHGPPRFCRLTKDSAALAAAIPPHPNRRRRHSPSFPTSSNFGEFIGSFPPTLSIYNTRCLSLSAPAMAPFYAVLMVTEDVRWRHLPRPIALRVGTLSSSTAVDLLMERWTNLVTKRTNSTPLRNCGGR